MARSIEEIVEDHFKRQLNGLGVRYYRKTESVNVAIDRALRVSDSKSGGSGQNYPDIKLLIVSENNRIIPVMIEAKGSRGKLVKLDDNNNVVLESKSGKRTAITDFAVNGAVHYANAILDEGTYQEVLAIGVNGYEDKVGNLFEIAVYYVSEDNAREPIRLDKYSDLTFLDARNIKNLCEELDQVRLSPEEREELKRRKHSELEKEVKAIHQSIYDDADVKNCLSTNDKLFLFSGLIMASLTIPRSSDLTVDSLKGNCNRNDHDGHVILERIRSFLIARESPQDKLEMVVRHLTQVFEENKLLWTPKNGISPIKRYYRQVVERIVPILKLRLNVDFTGIILTSLKDWMDLDNDKKNDVVLTPRYVTDLMARLARTDMNSFVWDTAMGSGGFLISAMEQMIADVKTRIPEKQKQEEKIKNIKENQLLGMEVLPNIYILAVINMILTGDGSAGIKNMDSFDYQAGSNFPYNVFLLNPPYSAAGKGFSFVAKALKMMTRGYGCVLIQENAGSGTGLPYTKQILTHSTLVASIHMADIFKGKAGVQTAIYLFKVNRPHQVDDLVTFVDFSNDGYFRQNRRKSSEDVNLQDADHAAERYREVVAIILNQKKSTDYYNERNGTVVRDTITLNGNDWTFAQHKKVDTNPTIEDFKDTVKDYLSWRVSQVLHDEEVGDQVNHLSSRLQRLEEDFRREGGHFEEIELEKIFVVKSNPQLNKKSFTFRPGGQYPYFTRTVSNNGILGYVDYLDDAHKIKGNSLAVGMLGMRFFYMKTDFYAGQFTKTVFPRFDGFNERVAQFFIAQLNRCSNLFLSVLVRDFERTFKKTCISVPLTSEGEIAISYIEKFIRELEADRIRELEKYLIVSGWKAIPDS